MPSRRFKLIYLPEGRSAKKEINLTRTKVFALAAALIAVMLITVTGLGSLTAALFPNRQILELNQENRVLSQQVIDTEKRLVGLEKDLKRLAERDTELRLMVDLPLIDEATRQAGIGGNLPSPGIDPAEDMRNLLKRLEQQVSIQKRSYPEILKKMEDNKEIALHTPAISPLTNMRITGRFGWRPDPFTGIRRPHKGMDFGAVRGTPVLATADGRVVLVKRVPTFGKVVVIDHGYGYETVYGHLNSFEVMTGERVKRGQVIGGVGNTGRSTAPHLHYEVHVNNKAVDPLDFVFDESVAIFK